MVVVEVRIVAAVGVRFVVECSCCGAVACALSGLRVVCNCVAAAAEVDDESGEPNWNVQVILSVGCDVSGGN